MTHDLQLRPFRSPADEGWAEAMTIYREAFPRRERRNDATQAAALADPAFRAEGIWLNDKIAGLVFYWEHPEFHYIEHLALSPAMRARNIGSEVLETFCRNRRVILEIEPPEDTLTVRRLRFLHPPLLRRTCGTPPAGADEQSESARRRRSPRIRGLREGTGNGLFATEDSAYATQITASESTEMTAQSNTPNTNGLTPT